MSSFDISTLAFFAFLILSLVVLAIWFYSFATSRQKKREEEAARWDRVREEEEARRDEENSKRWILEELQKEILRTFAVELDTIHDIRTQNEIVRIVNLMAHETATACVNQDKAGRGEATPPCYPQDPTFPRFESVRWGETASRMKIKWSNTRKLALQIAPKLADQMPHFSEFEPLKSYNAEYAFQKKTKK